MVENKGIKRDHKLILVNQEQMELTGISRVESFDSEEISLATDFGLVGIKGEDLDMRNLNLEQGVVEVVGLVTEVIYTSDKFGAQGSKGLLKRFFK